MDPAPALAERVASVPRRSCCRRCAGCGVLKRNTLVECLANHAGFFVGFWAGIVPQLSQICSPLFTDVQAVRVPAVSQQRPNHP